MHRIGLDWPAPTSATCCCRSREWRLPSASLPGRLGMDMDALASGWFAHRQSFGHTAQRDFFARSLRFVSRGPALDARAADRRLTGRLAVDTLVEYLNLPGATIVILSMVAVSVYLSTAFSFNTAREWLAVRMAFLYAWRDRVRELAGVARARQSGERRSQDRKPSARS